MLLFRKPRLPVPPASSFQGLTYNHEASIKNALSFTRSFHPDVASLDSNGSLSTASRTLDDLFLAYLDGEDYCDETVQKAQGKWNEAVEDDEIRAVLCQAINFFVSSDLTALRAQLKEVEKIELVDSFCSFNGDVSLMWDELKPHASQRRVLGFIALW